MAGRPSSIRRRRGRSWLIALLALCTLLWTLCGRLAHAGNPDLRWRTLETEHFYVHYYVGEEEAADRVAMVAERAYDNLSIAFGHRVFLKTHIVVTDLNDVANGSATAVPFPQINARVTAPESLSVLETYDDWIDILITHELVHVVHLDTVHGIPRLINAIFGFGVLGKIMSPNIVQPRWIIEGIATFEESDDTTGGRNRSAQFDMYLRMAVLHDLFQDIDQASSGARIWPHGSSVYLYGLHFMYYIAARYGQDKLRELSHIYAGQLVPFGINRAVRKVLGVDFYQLWNEFKEDTQRRFRAQARRIRSRGLRQGRRLTYSGETARYPFWSVDDRFIHYYGEDGHSQDGIKRVPRTGARVREGIGIGRQGATVGAKLVIQVEDVSAGTFVGASGDIVLDMLGTHDIRYRWSDLYRWAGGDPRELEQLTFGLRASEPHASPDGRTVVFRRNDMAQSRLGFLDLATGDVREVDAEEKLQQVYTPRWAPDGTKVAYSGWREGGYRDIYVHDVASKSSHRITADRHLDLSPTWTPDGRYLLFTSDRDDVFNVYAHDTRTGRLHQVTNVLGGAFEPAVSHDGKLLAYIGFSANGFDVWVMEFDPEHWLPVMPMQADTPPARDPKPSLRSGTGTRPTAVSERYKPIKTFFPRTLFPAALDFSASQFATSVGLTLGMADIVGFHELLASFNWIPTFDVFTGGATYWYRRLFPDFRLLFSSGFRVASSGFTRYDYDHEVDQTYLRTSYRERNFTLRGDGFVPMLRHPRHNLNANAGYEWTRWLNLDRDELEIDPNAPVTSLPEVGDATAVHLGISYSSLDAERFTLGSYLGRRVAINMSILDRNLGGDFGDLQVTAGYIEALPMPWRGHQVLVLEVAGGAAAGGLRRRGAFCLGGLLDGQDVFLSLVQRTTFSSGGCRLFHGYPPSAFRGQYFVLTSLDYRIPIADVDRGMGVLPFFWQRVGIIPFVDWGRAWTDPIKIGDLAWSTGARLFFGFRLGYLDEINLVLEYAHGFAEEGIDSFRATVSTAF